jgi:NAD(P)H-nitrite reductase large subunit
MRPEEADEGAMRIGPLVGMLMMHPVNTDPAGGRVLEAAHAQNGIEVLKPCGTNETAMGEQTVDFAIRETVMVDLVVESQRVSTEDSTICVRII